MEVLRHTHGFSPGQACVYTSICSIRKASDPIAHPTAPAPRGPTVPSELGRSKSGPAPGFRPLRKRLCGAMHRPRPAPKGGQGRSGARQILTVYTSICSIRKASILIAHPRRLRRGGRAQFLHRLGRSKSGPAPRFSALRKRLCGAMRPRGGGPGGRPGQSGARQILTVYTSICSIRKASITSPLP